MGIRAVSFVESRIRFHGRGDEVRWTEVSVGRLVGGA